MVSDNGKLSLFAPPDHVLRPKPTRLTFPLPTTSAAGLVIVTLLPAFGGPAMYMAAAFV